MPSSAPSRVTQTDFAAGMFRSLAPELIPQNGSYDLTNALLDENGAVTQRGGGAYVTTADLGFSPQFIWSGWLTGGRVTIIGDATHLKVVDESTGAVTDLSGSVTAGARPAVMRGTIFLPGGDTWTGTGAIGSATHAATYYAVAGRRLLYVDGSDVKFSAIDDATTYDVNDYHAVPGGVVPIGLLGVRDKAAVFTTEGVWLISGLTMDLTDASGNVQQTLDRYGDIVLWGDLGVVPWQNGAIVPALDGVWVMQVGSASEVAQPFARISDAISLLYRRYVALGYDVGQAQVFRGHYFLPIVEGSSLVDLLVCRLDATNSRGQRTFPWTHFGGGGQMHAMAVTDTQPQRLLCTRAQRVVEGHYFDQAAHPLDADGTAPELDIVTRDFATGALNPNTALKLRTRYEMVGSAGESPVLEAWCGTNRLRGSEWGLFDWGGSDWTPAFGELVALEGEAPPDVGASHPYVWWVRKKASFVRFRLKVSGGTSRLSLRSLEMFVRDAGRM